MPHLHFFNSSPDTTQGCNCNTGYFGEKPLALSSSCTACYSECSSCTSEYSCNTCIDPNATPNTQTNIGCVCKDGYWGTAPLSTAVSCLPCYSECARCEKALTCLTCLTTNASPDTFTGTGCSCDPGFYLDGGVLCEACPGSCNTCSDFDACTTCNITYANPTSNALCECPEGSVEINYVCQCSGGYTISYNNTSPLYYCEKCDGSCSTCIGTADTDCVTCAANLEYNFTTRLCNVCPDGSYFSNYQCLSCSLDCRTCTGYEICSSCADSIKVLNSTGQCNLDCGKGRC